MLPVTVVSIVMITFVCHSAFCQDDDDEIKGPIMPVKPDGALYTTAELIELRKHKGETHYVTTEDGYVLTVFRVVPTQQPPAAVVLLQHGYLTSSDCWVTDSDSLAFKLSDAGFDVWINNVRGNVYSRNHTKLKPQDKEFWDFSWHEMGAKDLPAVIDYVLQKTGDSKLHYIGHSMGCTVGFVLVTTRPEYNQRLRSLVNLAPAVFLSKMTEMVGPDGMVEEMAAKYMEQFKSAGKVEVFPRKDTEANDALQLTCKDIEENYRDMCVEKMEDAQNVLGGAYLPAGQSFKTMEHFYQLAVYGSMKFYNMSEEENNKAYGSAKPPSYTEKFSQISAPVLLWTAEADQLFVAKDVEDLVSIIPKLEKNQKISEECFDHVAFLFPRTKSCIPVRSKVYSDVIEAIKTL